MPLASPEPVRRGPGLTVASLIGTGQFVHDKSMTMSYTRRQKERLPTSRTFSMPPEMAEQVQRVLKEEGRSMSEFLRGALRPYMQKGEWRRLQRYGTLRARKQGIAPEDVERLVDEYRAEGSQDRTSRKRKEGANEPTHRLHTGGSLRQGV